MPRRLTAVGALLAAEDRTLTGTLLPYGITGHTNAGRVIAGPGSVRVPSDLTQLHAGLDHLDDREAVATFRDVRETPAGLVARWDVPRTHGGDRLLAEFREGKRTGISVELEPFAIKDGRLTASALVGCAFPVEPAFPTARLMAELAPDAAEDDPDDDEDPEVGAQRAAEAAAAAQEWAGWASEDATAAQLEADRAAGAAVAAGASADDITDPDEDEESTTVPTQLAASRTRRAAAAPAGAPGRTAPSRLMASKAADVYALLAQAHRTRDTRLLAALSDITDAPGGIVGTEQPQWLGELWSGIPYQRRVVPLVNGPAALTGMKLSGWRWVTKPVMAPYAGRKADVPSSPAQTEPVELSAERLAGAHDIDRKFRDFGDAGFFAAYYAAMAESYARLSDQAVVAELLDAAQLIEPGVVPADISPGMAAVVDGALAIVDHADPSFALVSKGMYRSILLTPADKRTAYLDAALGIDREGGQVAGFRVLPDPQLTGTQVLVGARQAATFHELGGPAPIRAEAVDMVKGGIDAGCFGYYAVNVHDDDALVQLGDAAEPAPTA